MYKFIIFVVLCFINQVSMHEFVKRMAWVGLTEEEKQGIINIHEHCIEESGLSQSDHDEINRNYANGIFGGNDNPKLKCFMACGFETIGVLDDSKFDVDAFIELLPAKLKIYYQRVKEGCPENFANKGDKCQTAYNVNKCSFDLTDEELRKAQFFLL